MQSNDERNAMEALVRQHKNQGWTIENTAHLDYKEHFIDGALCTIGFDRRRDGVVEKTCENRIYIVGGKTTVFANDRALISGVTGRKSSFGDLFSARELPKLIAAIIVLAVIALAFTTKNVELQKTLGQSLIAALAGVIGYFYGAKIAT
jgi:hypothetical protein